MTEVAEVAPPKHRSVSQLDSYSRCGEAYRLSRIEKVESRPAAWFHQGTAFHYAVEEWENSSRLLADDQVIDMGTQHYGWLIDQEAEEKPIGPLWMTGGRTRVETDIQNRGLRVAEQLAMYLHYAKSNTETVVVSELEFNIKFGDVPVRGFIDQVIEWPDGSLTPRDLKTGSKRPSWALQLGVYSHAVGQHFNVPRPLWGDFYIAKDGQPDPMVDLSIFTYDYLTQLFTSMNKAVLDGIFLPNPGDACRVCDVAPHCAVGAK